MRINILYCNTVQSNEQVSLSRQVFTKQESTKWQISLRNGIVATVPDVR
jgi:hypothetical protein